MSQDLLDDQGDQQPDIVRTSMRRTGSAANWRVCLIGRVSFPAEP